MEDYVTLYLGEKGAVSLILSLTGGCGLAKVYTAM